MEFNPVIKNTKKLRPARPVALVATETDPVTSQPEAAVKRDAAAGAASGSVNPANAALREQRQAARRIRQNANASAGQEDERNDEAGTKMAGITLVGLHSEMPSGKPVGEPVAEPVEEPTGEPTGEPIGEPTGEPVGNARPLPAALPTAPVVRGAGRKGGRAGKAVGDLAPIIVRPAAAVARPKRRHWMLLFSFIALVVVPGAVVAFYLWAVAVNQYASVVGFSVRSEYSSPTPDLLGQLSELSGASSTDTDILYQFIQSQELVDRINANLDLKRLYSIHQEQDPVFSYDPAGSIEDLVEYWERMVKIAYDPDTGLMEITALAFTPQDARNIAQAILDESTLRINELSAIARGDATRYAQEELDVALDRLREARLAFTKFRMQTQIVDPALDIQGRMGLLNTLQAELATALIDLDLLTGTTNAGDTRLLNLERRIEVIRARIVDERSRFGAGGEGPGGEDYATLVGEFERLEVDRQFAETAYTGARATYDASVISAQHTSRYLAAHIKPTLAEASRYPQRGVIIAVFMLFAFLVWATGALVYYSVRDRR